MGTGSREVGVGGWGPGAGYREQGELKAGGRGDGNDGRRNKLILRKRCFVIQPIVLW